MRFVGLALAGVLAITTPTGGHAAGAGSICGQPPPCPCQMSCWCGMAADRAGAREQLAATQGSAVSGNGTAGRALLTGGQNRQYGPRGFYGPPVPTYWVWVPGSAVFDYPFADWRGPTGGWGNP